MMSVQTEIVNLTTATTSLLNEVTTKKVVLDEAADKATAALDATKVSEAAAKASEIAAKTSENNAKTQADRAKTEADRASQISGLSTVSDAIGLAALQLPDVWAPLSDNLRMITGYGRDVLVGSDVVTRMVNFSRSTTATYIGKDGLLKTAAVNEPRFEKEGLLIEGQSTNLIPRSHQFNWSDGYGASPAVQSPNTDPQTSSLITTIDVTAGRRRPLIAGIMTVGKKYTISFRAKSDGGAISQAANPLTGAVYPAVAPGEWKTYSFTGVATSSIADFQITGTSVSIAWIQVEELPFATSYIPTNGAAATRAADYVTIPRDGNLPTDAFTFCVTVADFSAFDSMHNSVVLAPELSSAKERFYLSHGADKKPIMSMGNATIKAPSANLLVKPIGVSVSIGGAAKLFCNGSVQVSASAIGAIVIDTTLRIGGYKAMSQTGCLFGHVRNLRIWHRALTDDQLKAVA